MLKLGVPDRELGTEIKFLQASEGGPVVRLLEADPGRGALLLDRIRPGRPLSKLENDQEAARIGARLIREMPLPVPAEHDFPTLFLSKGTREKGNIQITIEEQNCSFWIP